ncbi:short-chain dehydrogenase/reductase SDR [Mycolicibacterium canariasense]|uniref:Short-chain dehydrogenase/reductase SDR n=1 Tax=Mycolicibacterium canariasense TaxID=228230 RepID=A0A100WA66_MYCCR|nr:hypothetical protein [Mycolicibacterium canariasense]MCV7208811.1 hypothetical protein [Mycolicibacterium canariasense]ORV07124.1 hypothetical protein AWB94_14070 [Mycolicibacterium canariasense]GAS94401.1 short-chain dehydrogenase/reductase SDR [Mycolicibacterium canariasense]
MAADLGALSGDVAGLIDYRRHRGGMIRADATPIQLGRTYVTVKFVPPDPAATRMINELVPRRPEDRILHPDDAVAVFPDIATGGRCGTCYSTDRAVVIGLICPDDWHDGPHETHWRRIAIQTFALIVAAVWLLALFLLTIGVI